MKYVKYFESFNEDDFDTEQIAKNLLQYSQEWPRSYWGPVLGIIDVDNDKPTIEQITRGIDNLIDEAKGSKLHSFLRRYDEVIKRGYLHIKLEEVEDLFLDLKDYTITKTTKFDNQDIFNILVDIKNVDDSEIHDLINHIYGAVKNRLQDTLYIKRVTVLREDDGKYDVKVRLFENIKKTSPKTTDLDDLMQRIREIGRREEEENDW